MTEAAKTPSPAPDQEPVRLIRYLLPNAVTAASLMFGLISIVSAHAGNYALAAWMVMYAVMTDRVDGLVARALRATSAFGMQLDSFADFLNFGVAPANLVYAYLVHRPDLPYAEAGWERYLMMAACGLWVLGAVFRLARYNVTSDEDLPTKIFFGIPTTLAGGLLAAWFLVFHKYDAPGETFSGAKLFGDVITPRGVWLYLPIALVVGAYLMVSSLPMPKLVSAKSRAVTAFIMVNVLVGYGLGFAMMYPDIMVWQPSIWMVVFLIWGQVSKTARGLTPPRLFPRRDDGKLMVRPQEDMGPDEEVRFGDVSG